RATGLRAHQRGGRRCATRAAASGCHRLPAGALARRAHRGPRRGRGLPAADHPERRARARGRHPRSPRGAHRALDRRAARCGRGLRRAGGRAQRAPRGGSRGGCRGLQVGDRLPHGPRHHAPEPGRRERSVHTLAPGQLPRDARARQARARPAAGAHARGGLGQRRAGAHPLRRRRPRQPRRARPPRGSVRPAQAPPPPARAADPRGLAVDGRGGLHGLDPPPRLPRPLDRHPVGIARDRPADRDGARPRPALEGAVRVRRGQRARGCLVRGARRARGTRARARHRRRAPLAHAGAGNGHRQRRARGKLPAPARDRRVTAGPEALLDLIDAPDGALALVEPASGERTTYGELRATAERLARSLAAAGVGPGDAVAMSLPNGPEIVAAFLGVVAAGAAAAPLNQAYTGDEFHAYLDDLRPRAMLFLRGEESPARASCAALGVRQLELTGACTAELGLADLAAGSTAPRDPEAVALLLHTSGTTSKPKGVPIRQRNLAASARAVAATYGLSGGDTSHCAMPLFHVHGLVASTLATLGSGGCVIAPRRFSASAFWGECATHGATWYSAVPTIHRILLSRAEEGASDHSGHGLRFVRSCSSALPGPLMD